MNIELDKSVKTSQSGTVSHGIISQPAKKQYLKSPFNCPYCGSKWIHRGFAANDNEILNVNMSCERCDRMWLEKYKLIDIEEYAEGNNA